MSKHTAVFVYDEEHKTIVIESLDGVRYVPEVKQENQYQKYVGKFLKCIKGTDTLYTTGKWYEVIQSFHSLKIGIKDNWKGGSHCTTDDGSQKKLFDRFDLSDPRDSNPDEKPTITTAHSSLVIDEDQTQDYKRLVGKWVKCIYCNMDEWVQILGLSYSRDCFIVSDIQSEISGGSIVKESGRPSFHISFLEINNPKDFKPHPIPSEVMEGLMLLPTDHPEYGNIREEAIELGERCGQGSIGIHTNSENKILRALYWLKWSPGNKWRKISDLAESGAFDPQPVEIKIPFSYDIWKKNDFIRVETRDGKLVQTLTYFETDNYSFAGAVEGINDLETWVKDGCYHLSKIEMDLDLFLIVKQ